MNLGDLMKTRGAFHVTDGLVVWPIMEGGVVHLWVCDSSSPTAEISRHFVLNSSLFFSLIGCALRSQDIGLRTADDLRVITETMLGFGVEFLQELVETYRSTVARAEPSVEKWEGPLTK